MTSQVFASESMDLLLCHDRCHRMTIYKLALFLFKSFRKKGGESCQVQVKKTGRGTYFISSCVNILDWAKAKKKKTAQLQTFFSLLTDISLFCCCKVFSKQNLFYFFLVPRIEVLLECLATARRRDSCCPCNKKTQHTDELVRIRMALVRVVKCPKLCPRRSRVRTPGACFVF